jgi:hypothetical protein
VSYYPDEARWRRWARLVFVEDGPEGSLVRFTLFGLCGVVALVLVLLWRVFGVF